MTKSPWRRRLAIHEAGHALVAFVVGEVASVELGDGVAHLGATRRQTHAGDGEYSMAERYILVAVAGYCAERLCGDNESSLCDTDTNSCLGHRRHMAR
jgi:hypothetical protein